MFHFHPGSCIRVFEPAEVDSEPSKPMSARVARALSQRALPWRTCLSRGPKSLLRGSYVATSGAVSPHGSLAAAEARGSNKGLRQAFRGLAVKADEVQPRKVIMVTDDDHFNDALKDAQTKGGLATVYYTAKWCGPCRAIAPFVDDLSKDQEKATFLKVDIDEPRLEKTVNKGGISAVPTFHFYRGGKLIGQLTGASTQQLKKMVEDYSKG